MSRNFNKRLSGIVRQNPVPYTPEGNLYNYQFPSRFTGCTVVPAQTLSASSSQRDARKVQSTTKKTQPSAPRDGIGADNSTPYGLEPI